MPQSTEPSIFYKPERSLLPERHRCKTDKLDRAPSHALLQGKVQPQCCRYANPPRSPCGWSTTSSSSRSEACHRVQNLLTSTSLSALYCLKGTAAKLISWTEPPLMHYCKAWCSRSAAAMPTLQAPLAAGRCRPHTEPLNRMGPISFIPRTDISTLLEVYKHSRHGCWAPSSPPQWRWAAP